MTRKADAGKIPRFIIPFFIHLHFIKEIPFTTMSYAKRRGILFLKRLFTLALNAYKNMFFQRRESICIHCRERKFY
jgi:hypothetical protein